MELPKGQALQAMVQTRVLYASIEKTTKFRLYKPLGKVAVSMLWLKLLPNKGQAQQPARESHIVNALIVATAEGQALQAPRKADII